MGFPVYEQPGLTTFCCEFATGVIEMKIHVCWNIAKPWQPHFNTHPIAKKQLFFVLDFCLDQGGQQAKFVYDPGHRQADGIKKLEPAYLHPLNIGDIADVSGKIYMKGMNVFCKNYLFHSSNLSNVQCF